MLGETPWILDRHRLENFEIRFDPDPKSQILRFEMMQDKDPFGRRGGGGGSRRSPPENDIVTLVGLETSARRLRHLRKETPGIVPAARAARGAVGAALGGAGQPLAIEGGKSPPGFWRPPEPKPSKTYRKP